MNSGNWGGNASDNIQVDWEVIPDVGSPGTVQFQIEKGFKGENAAAELADAWNAVHKTQIRATAAGTAVVFSGTIATLKVNGHVLPPDGSAISVGAGLFVYGR